MGWQRWVATGQGSFSLHARRPTVRHVFRSLHVEFSFVVIVDGQLVADGISGPTQHMSVPVQSVVLLHPMIELLAVGQLVLPAAVQRAPPSPTSMQHTSVPTHVLFAHA